MPEVFNSVRIVSAALHQNSYRSAVAAVINGIKADLGESDQDVADRLGTSATTINPASTKRGARNAVTLLRIGKEYGLHRLGPVMGLIGGKAAPIEAVCTSDTQLPVGAARGQLFLAKALADEVISDDELVDGAEDIEAAYQTFGVLTWRVDSVRVRRQA